MGANDDVRVPREPTQAMVAEILAWMPGAWDNGERVSEKDARDLFRKLLAATPAAQPATDGAAVREPFGYYVSAHKPGYGFQETFTRSPVMAELVKHGMSGAVDVTPLFDDPPPHPSQPSASDGGGQLPPSCGPAETLSNETLVEVATQSAARLAMYGNKVQHDRLQECKGELLRRLNQCRSARVDDPSSESTKSGG